MKATPHMQAYFNVLKKQTQQEHAIATAARQKGYDAKDEVEIKLAKNMAERVVGLISVLAPQVSNPNVVERIIELEKKYGSLDWRVAFKIAEEIAKQEICTFESKEKAIEVGIRMGFAYSTMGVVSSPLDGLIRVEIDARKDGRGKYFTLYYAGPIRNAGGTNAAISVLIADYVRKKLKYDVFDVTEKEVKRMITEVRDYDERIAPRQHKPTDEELTFLFNKLPLHISGEPSEKIDVSNHKDLERIPTNKIRSGFALLCTDCVPLKAPKLWKQLKKWGNEFDMEQWNFLEELIVIQKKGKSKGGTKTNEKISPDFSFIKDMVAGRPVISHPLAKGGMRLRYGRSRTSGYSAQCLHPATMHVLNQYVASGTQLKVERPGKGAAYTPCDTIEGPIVKLDDDSVLFIDTEQQAKQYKKRIKEILFIGDVLINYGDFLDRAHPLVPSGYCEEWWIQEIEPHKEKITGISPEIIQAWFANPFHNRPTVHQAILVAQQTNTPLHPRYTFHWKDITKEQFNELVLLFDKITLLKENTIQKVIIPYTETVKRTLEELGIPHIKATDSIVIEKEFAASFAISLNLPQTTTQAQAQLEEDVLVSVNKLSPLTIRDKSGIYIGARMGRPEKAKMRKMTGSPQGLFPVGEEGGRTRSFQYALAKEKVTADFPLYRCTPCKTTTVYRKCETCDVVTTPFYYCRFCKQDIKEKECEKHGEAQSYKRQSIPIKHYFKQALQKINTRAHPELIKGVRGTLNKTHYTEHLGKAILRAKHDLYVNKDGTIRYDCSEIAITHFKPKEIRTSIARLKELGYTKDIHGKELTQDNQVLEIKPQDVILPSCPKGLFETADDIYFRVTQFIDELLVEMYGLEPFYNLKTKQDLVGHLIIGLAPHTSAGMLGRIIGFSSTQTFLAHPYYHASERRDCDGDELGFMLLLDAFLNFSKDFLPATRGGAMDAPLVLTSVLTPAEVDDMAFNVDIVWKYPLALYEAAQEYKMPWDVKIKIIQNVLDTDQQYENMGFTHDTDNINAGVICSAYKTLPTMIEKLEGQMDLAVRIRAVQTADVARLVIEKHFIRDTKGNLRKFSMQQVRCVQCNEKYRRVPLVGKCVKCNSRLIFTISEGSVIKYLQPSIDLANKYDVSPYLKQTMDVLYRRVQSVFGKEKEKQTGLGEWG